MRRGQRTATDLNGEQDSVQRFAAFFNMIFFADMINHFRKIANVTDGIFTLNNYLFVFTVTRVTLFWTVVLVMKLDR